MMTPLTPAEFAALIPVSRETLSRLEAYLILMKRWQSAINLVGPATLEDPWRRHILDSAQLLPYIPDNEEAIYDIGSGAGLPGLVLAAMGKTGIHLVESDQRKAIFLKEVIRTLNLDVDLHTQRIETLPHHCASMVTARALAPLPRLLGLASPILKPNAFCLFLKGVHAFNELTEARKCWRMSATSFPSLSDPKASVLKLRDIIRAPIYRK